MHIWIVLILLLYLCWTYYPTLQLTLFIKFSIGFIKCIWFTCQVDVCVLSCRGPILTIKYFQLEEVHYAFFQATSGRCRRLASVLLIFVLKFGGFQIMTFQTLRLFIPKIRDLWIFWDNLLLPLPHIRSLKSACATLGRLNSAALGGHQEFLLLIILIFSTSIIIN